MTYAYIRVSSAEQHLDRQIVAIREVRPDIEDTHIYSDKQSGKNFERAGYKLLKSVLAPGDEVIIKELDRLGRNKEGIKEELKWFKDNDITVRILNIPTTLIDFQGQEWIRDMINNIIVEVLSSIAEEEREKIHQRQSEGIAAAKAKGVKFGRPTGYTGGFDEAYSLVTSGEMTVVEACTKLNISRTQWYRMVKTAS